MRRQRTMAQMKEQNKTPEKELNEMETGNLSDAHFKTLVIRMLQELIGYLNSIKKTQAEMKVALCEIKKNLQGTNREWMNLRIKSMIWNRRKKKAFNQNSRKKIELKKIGIALGTSGTSLNVPKSKSADF